MHVSDDGRVSGSIDRAKLAQLYADTDDADLKQHYEEMAAWDGWALEQLEETEPEPEPEPEPVKKTAAKKTAAKEATDGD